MVGPPRPSPAALTAARSRPIGQCVWVPRPALLAMPLVVGTAVLMAAPIYSDSGWHLDGVLWAVALVGFAIALPMVLLVPLRSRVLLVLGSAALTLLVCGAVVAMERSSHS